VRIGSPTGLKCRMRVRCIGTYRMRPRMRQSAVVGFENVISGPDGGPYACPCCGYVTLRTRGGFDICGVCFWEGDGQADHDAGRVRGGPNGALSLTEARANFARIGASDERSLPHVREPRPEERPR